MTSFLYKNGEKKMNDFWVRGWSLINPIVSSVSFMNLAGQINQIKIRELQREMSFFSHFVGLKKKKTNDLCLL